MAVHKYRRARDGATVYCAAYLCPEGTRRVEKAAIVKVDASQRDHGRAESKARELANTQRFAVENGTWTDPRAERELRRQESERALRFGALVERFLADYRPRSGDIRYYKQRSKCWREHFGDSTPAAAIGVADVDAFRKAREQDKVGPSTLRKDLVSLGTLFRWARARGLVKENPADSDLVSRPPEPRHRDQYLTDEEERQLLEALPEWMRPMIRFAVNTGMDRGEVLALQVRDVDRKHRVIHATRSKTNTSRKIPLEGAVEEAVAEATKVRKLRPDSAERVFLAPGLVPLPLGDDNQADRVLERAYVQVGITKGQPWKILRHTFGTRLAAAGVAGPKIAYLMGHRSLATSSRYVSLQADDVRDAMALLAARSAQRPAQGAEDGAKTATGERP